MSNYFEAAIPDPVVVLGLLLKPLSLSHLHRLSRIESPFIAGGEVSPQDLVSAALICSTDHDEWVELMASDDKDKEVQEWVDSLGQIDWHTECETFCQYMNAQSQGPRYRAPAGEGKANSPGVAQIKVAMMSEFGMPEQEVMSRPYALCLWDLAILAERRGTLTIETDEMRAEYLEAKRLADELDKRRN